MIRSMTGYGQASVDLSAARIRVEARSVNHRYSDVRLRLAQEVSEQERDIRRRVLERVRRGRVELALVIEGPGGAEPRPMLNRTLLDEVLEATKSLKNEFGIKGEPELNTLLGLQGMFRVQTADLVWGEDEQQALETVLDQALDALDTERLREGSHLAGELISRLLNMSEITAKIRVCAADLPDSLRDNLIERLNHLSRSVELDPQRVAQEAAILADRADVTEEVVRLEGHLEQARSLVGKPDGQPVGKRLDFLLQEINRETNTINSKSSDLMLSRHALDLKAEVEKVREQVQNLE